MDAIQNGTATMLNSISSTSNNLIIEAIRAVPGALRLLYSAPSTISPRAIEARRKFAPQNVWPLLLHAFKRLGFVAWMQEIPSALTAELRIRAGRRSISASPYACLVLECTGNWAFTSRRCALYCALAILSIDAPWHVVVRVIGEIGHVGGGLCADARGKMGTRRCSSLKTVVELAHR